MKKLRKIAFVYLSFCSFISCENNNDIELFKQQTVNGAFVQFKDTPLNGVGIESIEELVYTFNITDPNASTSKYELRLFGELNGIDTEIVNFKVINSFPTQVVITGSEILEALKLDPSKINYGDKIKFQGVSTNFNNISSYVELIKNEETKKFEVGESKNLASNLVNSKGFRGAYLFEFTLFCSEAPIKQLIDNIIGTYEVIVPGIFFPENISTREIIKGPKTNQITIIGGEYPSYGSENLVLNLENTFGNVSLGKEGVSITEELAGFPSNYGEVKGTIFSCSGRIELESSFESFPGFEHPFILKK